MSDFSLTTQFIISAVTGATLAYVFFGGLWWTVNRTLTSASPHLVVLSSFLIRMAIVLSGFWWIARAGWRQLLVATGSFMLLRLVLVRRFGAMPAEMTQRGVG